MSYAEFVDWCAFASVEPFGEAREDLRNALLMALLANLHSAPGSTAPKFEDFLINYWGDEETPADAGALIQKFLILAGRQAPS